MSDKKYDLKIRQKCGKEMVVVELFKLTTNFLFGVASQLKS